MALLADYHIHTVYSRHHHGKSTIEDTVRAAYEKGLAQIAITDHGVAQAFPEAFETSRKEDMNSECRRKNLPMQWAIKHTPPSPK